MKSEQLIPTSNVADVRSTLELVERYGFTVVVAVILLLFGLYVFRTLLKNNESLIGDLKKLAERIASIESSVSSNFRQREEHARLLTMIDEGRNQQSDLIRQLADVISDNHQKRRATPKIGMFPTSAGFLTIQKLQTALVVTVIREIPSIKFEIDAIIAEWDRHTASVHEPILVLDLHALKSVPSVFWGSALVLFQTVRNDGGRMFLIGVAPRVMADMRTLQLDKGKFWSVADSVAAACRVEKQD